MVNALAHIELVMNERIMKVKEVEKQLRSCSVQYLRAEVKRSHKVFDTKEFSKRDLVLIILTDRFGKAVVAAAFE